MALREVPRHGAGTFTRVRAVLAGALVFGISSAGVLAAWSDGELARTELAAGTFTLVSRTGLDEFASHGAGGAAALSWPATPLYPGQSKAAWVQLRSAGTVEGQVLLSGVDLSPAPPAGSAAEALRDALVVRVSATTSADPAPPPCTTSTPGVEATGLTQIPAIPALPLEADGSNTVTFCIVVTLPVDAPSAAQGAVLSPTWIFTGST